MEVRFNLDTLEGIDAFLALFEDEAVKKTDWSDQLVKLTYADFPVSKPTFRQLMHVGAVLARANPEKLHPQKAVLILRSCSGYKELLPAWIPFRDRMWTHLESNPDRKRMMRGLI